MATYFKSSQVHVFPCAYRGTDAEHAIDPEARLNTEKNLTNTGNNLKGTYLIERKYTQGSVDLLRVVIGGYYFEIDLSVSGGIGWSGLQNKYLAIKTIETPIVTSGANTTLLVAWGTTQAGYLDNSDGNFLGLAICDSGELTNATASIQVANNSGNILNKAYLPDISSSTGSKSLASDGCTATGNHAVSLGLGLTGATNPVNGQMVIGSYNADANGKLFVVGNGSVSSTSNAFTVNTDGDAAVTRNATIGGTLSATGNTTIGGTLVVTGVTTSIGDFKVGSGNGKFNVTATSGNTAISGTLGVTGNTTLSGNTTLNAIANKDTTIVNGALYFGNGPSGYITATGNAFFSGDDGVMTDKLSSTGQNPIELDSSIVPSTIATLNIGSTDAGFNTAYIKKISGYSLDNSILTLEGSSVKLNPTNPDGTVYATKNLYVGADSGAAFGNSGCIHATRDITAGQDLYATRDLIVSGIMSGTSTAADRTNIINLNSANTISGAGEANAAITLKGNSITTATNSITLAGNAIYSITFVRTGDTPVSAGVWAISTTLALPNSIDKTLIQSADFRQSTGSGDQFYANRDSTSSTSWTIHIASSINAASSTYLTGKWYVVKLCNITF